MIRRPFLLSATALLTIASPCLAVVEMPPDANGGNQGIPTSFLQRDGTDWLVWVAYEGYRPKTRWSERATAEGFRSLKFMESFRVLYEEQGSDGDYLLLGEANASGEKVEQVVGWVRKDCTIGPEALTVPGIRLHRKAMLIATAKTLERSADRFEDDAPVLGAPVEGLAPRRRVKPLNVFYIFGETIQRQYGIAGEDYVLVGNAPTFRPGEDEELSPTSVIQGWVPESRVALWNTREAVVWDRPSTILDASPRRTEPGCVFANAGDAKDYLDCVTGADEVALFREVFDDQQQSIPFKPHYMRYPILEWNAEDLRLTGPGEEPPKYLPRKYKPPGYPSNELLKIGCFGGNGGLSKERTEDLRRQLEKLREMVAASEILFVIADTNRMRQYYEDVADVVARITENARQTTRTVRVAVAFYDDTRNKPPGRDSVVLPERCFPLRTVTAHGGNIADIVKRHLPVGAGPPSGYVFRGITEAIEGAGFSSSARKLVIVIGDCGDRTDNLRDTKDEEAIVKKLLPTSESPIEFLAVQVCSATRDRFARDFLRQMDTIVRLLNERGQDDSRIQRTLGSYRNAAEADLAVILNRRLEDLDRRAAEINLLLESGRAGDTNTEIDAGYRAILQGAGIDIEKLKAQGGVQLFHEGHVWRYARGSARDVPQVRTQLMLDHATIEDIIGYMEKLTGSRPGLQGGNITIEKALAEVVTAATWEEPDPNLSVELQVFKRLGLVAKSPLLKTPIGANHSPRLAYSEIFEIAHRVDLLEDILEGKQREWDKHVGTFAGEAVPKYVPIGDAKAVDRHFTLPGSTVTWYWIDVEDELP